MAEFGAKHPCFQPEGSVGVVLGKLVAANLTVNLANGELYADDSLAEQLSEFSSGSLAMETDDMIDSVASVIYDATSTNGEIVYNQNDTPPRGGLAYYKALSRDNKKFYKGYYYPRARAALGNDNAQTRGSSITFQTTNTAFTIFSDDSGDWRKTKTFNDEQSAIAWVESKCEVGEYHEVNVSVQGASAGQSVDVIGTVYVPDGKNLVINIKGHTDVEVAYDNGVDVTTTITGGVGKYTLTEVDGKHTIAIIFGEAGDGA
jgi:hypothetical protein